MLTALLQRITLMEAEGESALSYIGIDPNSINNSWITRYAYELCPDIINYRSDIEIHQPLRDVYVRDGYLFDNLSMGNIGSSSHHVFLITVDGIYAGHIYAWSVQLRNMLVINVIGIR